MKNTIRVHRKGGKHSRPVQPKIPAGFELPADAPHPSCLAIYDRGGKSLVSKIPLTENEFGHLLVRAMHYPGGSGQFIADAVRKSIQGGRLPMAELEQAVNQSNGLLQLLVDKLEHFATVDGAEFSGVQTQQFIAGVNELTKTTQHRLASVFQNVFSKIHPKLNEVAS